MSATVQRRAKCSNRRRVGPDVGFYQPAAFNQLMKTTMTVWLWSLWFTSIQKTHHCGLRSHLSSTSTGESSHTAHWGNRGPDNQHRNIQCYRSSRNSDSHEFILNVVVATSSLSGLSGRVINYTRRRFLCRLCVPSCHCYPERPEPAKVSETKREVLIHSLEHVSTKTLALTTRSCLLEQ